MPTLNWIGKDAVIRHHNEVPFRLLEPDPALSHGDGSDGNLIVQGDNLHALKALLPKYAGRVKCIYIDPPYNTGNEGWIYNDKVNSPEINRWLGQTVGKEAEDLSRHDKWLCMMYPRLVLLKQFLTEDGAIFVSIDDVEVANARLILDEIFGAQNFITNVIWEKADSPRNSARYFSTDHDHVLVYSNFPSWTPNRLQRTEAANSIYKNPDNDPMGPWLPGDPYANKPYSKGLFTIQGPTGRSFSPPPGRFWRISEEKLRQLDEEGRIWWGPKGSARPSIKRYLSEVGDLVPRTIWSKEDAGSNRTSKNEMRSIFPDTESFDTPKPTRLIQRILQIASDKDSIILDSFAGSGTTGHAVLKQNAADGGNRKFILVEMEEQIASEITAERVRRVAAGYTDAKGNEVPGLGSGFQFCRLSAEPLFNEFGDIRDDVTFAELADFVWFAETGTGYGRDGCPSRP
ncbi:site-specific DNA-methyltransferase, partial [Pontiellaceae bacterium B1224]|nr:site-specific DNA-methyltransferase [Pontiellaceae bacterium B1224]